MIFAWQSAKAEEPDIKLMNATAYTGGTKTATGKTPREGFVAVDKAHMGDGWVAVVYRAIPNERGGYDIGEMLWILECEDTGPNGVSKGYTIDIYRDDLDGCQELMDEVYENGSKGKVFVQYVQGQG